MSRYLRRAAASGDRRANATNLVLALAVLFGSSARGADSVIDNRGFSSQRELVSQLPFEHVDPMTGNLLLTFTDLELPGNAGFDLRIQRTYNSKIYKDFSSLGSNEVGEDSWVGLGWRLHFGRVLQRLSSSPGPVIEMPDGSLHQSYYHLDGVLAPSSGHFMTRDHWTYEKVHDSKGILRLPSGLTYVFEAWREPYLNVTEIKDPFGNRIVVNYPPASAFTAPDAIASVEQRLATGEVRVVTFTTDELLPYPGSEPREARSLATMTYQPTGASARVWTYSQELRQPYNEGRTQLTGVKPPLGPSWSFEYRPGGPSTAANPAPSILAALTTPTGGRIDYAFAAETFRYGSSTVYSPVLETRTVSGPGVAAGNWQYAFDSPDWTLPITAVITSPCGKERYVTNAIGPDSDERPWAIGTLARKETLSLNDVVLQTEELDWMRSVPISNFPESGKPSSMTHLPLLQERRVTRGGKTYRTEYVYDASSYSPSRASNFNDHGRAREVVETGESGALTRKTTRTFFYASSTDPGFGTYIVDKTAAETVRVPAGGSEAYTSSYEYETSGGFRGFLKAQVVRGLRTEFTQELFAGIPTGNVKSTKDDNGNVTSFLYSWGRARQVTTPLHTITRVINPDGTLASETRRGFTTSFAYDALGRETRRTPPLGHPTVTVYDDLKGREVSVTRGPGGGVSGGGSRLTTTLDGLGRVVGTANNLGEPVKTSVVYDSCGRTAFQSYPFTGATGLAKGASFTYDALGRLVKREEPNDSSGVDSVGYAYGPGLKVTVTDENGNKTEQNWVAFSDPGETRLSSLKDAAGQTTAYSYNALGSLLSVTPPSGPGRSWTYYASEAGGKPGLLKSETHPESGTVGYTYDNAGNLKTRTDARGATTYAYDANNRLVQVARPDGYVLTHAYDASDNRTLLEHLMPGGVKVKSTFTYDGANRPTHRKDELTIKPPKVQVFNTAYAWDAFDRLDTLTYPSSTATASRKAKYTYDVAGRILSVANPGKRTYGDLFTYHPTGAVTSFRTGGGKVRSFDYTKRNRLKAVNALPTLQVRYEYEPNGNLQSIDDSRTGFDQTFDYDALDRLMSSTSPTSALAGSLAYDTRGNRTSSTLGGSATYAYQASTDRLQGVTRGGVVETLGYDGYGNLVTRQVGGDPAETFTYTPEHLLESATVGGLLTRYRYDGDGLRVAKEEAGGGLRFYLHGPGGQILSELRECPTSIEPVRDSIQAGGRLIAFVKPSPPTVSLLAAAASTTEQPGGSITLAVRITTVSGCPTPEAVTVAYATANGTALAGTDYTATSGSLTFPAGTLSGATQTVTVPLMNDVLVEPSETLSFKLSSPGGAILGTPTATTITVVDNDTPTVAWAPSAASALESSGSVTLTARVTTAEGNALPGSASASYTTANGTAVTPADYLAQSGLLTFAAGMPSGSQQTISVPVVKDGLVEKDETFKVVLGTPTGATVGVPSAATVSLLDASPQVAFSTTTFAGTEGASAVVGVTLVTPDGQPTLAPVTVKATTAGLTAKANVDFTSMACVLTFPAGAPNGSVQTMSVVFREDVLSEDTETLKVTLSAPKGGRLGTPSVTTVAVLDNDPLPLVSIADASVLEPNSGSKSMTFTARLSAPAGRTVSVDYATAPLNAQAGSDFTHKAGTLSFAAGVTTRTFAVPVLGDLADEENEAFLAVLANPVNLALGRAVAQGVVLDNDGQPALCQPIGVVPFTITSSGRYCLAGNVSFPAPTGDAITIEADFVRLDLGGYRIDGSGAGPETVAVGIQALDRTGLVVRNGRVHGFRSGVELAVSGSDPDTGLHLVEGVEAEGNTLAGLFVAGRHSTVRRSTVLSTGGIALGGEAGEDTYGITLVGPGARVLDNVVRGTLGNGAGVGRGIRLESANGCLAQGNVLGPAGGSGTGILVRGSQDVILQKNRLVWLYEGLVFDDSSTGVYRGNFSTGVTVPYQGGTDAGGNQ